MDKWYKNNVENCNSNRVLQDDLYKLLDRSNEWSLKFNESKCKVMHVGMTNPQYN